MEYVIYKIANKVNGKFYIGSSINFKSRKASHLRNLRKNIHHCIHLQRAFNEYGEDSFEFTFKVVDVPNEEALRMLEERYINFCWNSNMLYNTSKKGMGGDTITYSTNHDLIVKHITEGLIKRYAEWSEEDRKKWGEERKGKKNPNYGHRWSEELRKKVSNDKKEYAKTHESPLKGKKWEDYLGEEKTKIAKKRMSDWPKTRVGSKNAFFGMHHSEEFKKKISEMKKGNVPTNAKKVLYNGNIYASSAECGRQLNIPMVTVAYRCRKKLYGFTYIDENNTETK